MIRTVLVVPVPVTHRIILLHKNVPQLYLFCAILLSNEMEKRAVPGTARLLGS